MRVLSFVDRKSMMHLGEGEKRQPFIRPEIKFLIFSNIIGKLQCGRAHAGLYKHDNNPIIRRKFIGQKQNTLNYPVIIMAYKKRKNLSPGCQDRRLCRR
jgi:hypothetical protein